MTQQDLRLQYKRDTGNLPFMTDGNYMTEALRDPYFQWLEDLVLKHVKEKNVKKG
jgi:hypothetical protein